MVYGTLSLKKAVNNCSGREISRSLTTLPILHVFWIRREDGSDWLNQVQTERLPSLYGHSTLSPFIPAFYANEMLIDSCMLVVVRACAVRAKNTAKIQSFCSVSALLFLLYRKYVCQVLLICYVDRNWCECGVVVTWRVCFQLLLNVQRLDNGLTWKWTGAWRGNGSRLG